MTSRASVSRPGPPHTPILATRTIPLASNAKKSLIPRKQSSPAPPASSFRGFASLNPTFEEGSFAWLPDDEEVVVPVKVFQAFKRGEPGVVVRLRPNEASFHNEEETTRRRKLSIASRHRQHLRPSLTTITLSPDETSNLMRADDTSLVPTANMIEMVDLSEASLLHNLRLRYFEKVVYTSIGTILVSVNPFEALPLYTPEMVEKYRAAGSHMNRTKLGPHVYGLAHDAFANMIEHRQDQSCIVTGESGSGKTELTKLFLQYLMELSKGEDDDKKIVEGDEEAVEEYAEEKGNGPEVEDNLDFRDLPLSTRILTANPLLEAFGNAMTTRNDNSSRHGKWISVAFHKKKGSVMGANIQVYLLEKSRLVHRGTGERNFHIFYQLLAAASSDSYLRESLQLEGGVESFRYLASAEEIVIQGDPSNSSRINDARSWAQTMRSLRSVGTTRSEEGQLLQVLAGLLHLGNVEFAERAQDGSSVVLNRDVLDVASDLLGLGSDMLETSLTKKDVSNAKEKLFQNRSESQAKEARDALAKYVYGKVFDWVVGRIGVALGPSEENKGIPHSTIGMLDVFGFEVFERNSFEQLCINYANEKLQEQFNRKVFEMEREEYLAQGLGKAEVDELFSHVSNAVCLRMFEDKPSGIFAGLEDEIFVPRGTDANFLSKLSKSAPTECFLKIDALRFKVLHYAGEVEYDATNFLEKSRDRIDPLLEQLPSRSSGILSLIVGGGFGGIAPITLPVTPPQKKKEQKTLGTKFVSQLSDLLDALDMTEPHYARCIKPNDAKSPAIFKAQMVMSQLRYSGLLDVCRVRKRGFPARLDFEEFIWRYGNTVVASGTTPPSSPTRNLKEKCEQILQACGIARQDGFTGTTKVMLRHVCYDQLELTRDEALKQRVTTIQKLARGRLSRNSTGERKSALAKLAQLTATPNFTAQHMRELDEQLVAVRDLPSTNMVISNALAVKKKFEARGLALDLIAKASSTQEAAMAKKEALAVGISPDDPCLQYVNMILERQSEMSHIRSELSEAMDSRDLVKLERALSELTTVVESTENDGRSRSTSFTQDTISHAKALRERLRKEKEAVEVVNKAIAEDAAIDVLKAAYKGMLALGMESHPTAVAAAKLLKKKKRKENESKDLTMLKAKGSEDAKQTLIKLKQAENAKDLKALAEARHEAIEMGLDRAPDVQRAARLIQQLEDNNDLETSLGAATELVSAKAALKSGIGLNFQDIERLSEAITVAKQRGLSKDSVQFEHAVDVEFQVRAQLKIQSGLEDGLKERDYGKVTALLQDAAQLGLDNDLVRRARAVSSKRLGGDNGAKIGRTVSLKDRAQEIKQLSMRDFEKRRMERLQDSRDPRNDWWNLEEKQVLRTNEDFGTKRGAIFSTRTDRRRQARGKWKYTGKVIPKSLTVSCDKDDRVFRRAILMNKAMLGYCGDLVLPFPTVLAQQILEAALLDPPLADELWVQLLRQLTENPHEDSERRAWMLCAVCASCVGPVSPEVENAVLHFLIVQSIETAGMDPVNKEYARYALRRLEKIILEGPSGAIPTSEEIQAFQERPPMLATVNLPDGSELFRDYPVAPDVTVQDLVEACCVTYDIRTDLAYLFGLFVEVKNRDVTDRRTRTINRFELAKGIDLNTSAAAGAAPGTRTSLPFDPKAKPTAATTAPKVTFQVEQPSRGNGSMYRRVSTTMTSSMKTLKPGLFSKGDAASSSNAPGSRKSLGGASSSSIFSDSLVADDDVVTPEPQTLGGSSKSTNKLKLVPSKHKLRAKQTPDRVPEPLPATDHLGDTFTHHVGRNERLQFIFRRKIVSPPGQEPPGSMKEKPFVEICFLETVEEVLSGNWACPTREDAAEVAALIIAELRGGKTFSSVAPSMMSSLLEFVPVPWRQAAGVSEWARLIVAAAAKLKGMSGKDMRKALLAKAQKFPTYGLVCFPVRRGNDTLLIGCGAKGLHILEDSTDRKIMHVIPHIRVRQTIPFAESLSIDVWDEELRKVKERLSYITSQGHEIAGLLWELGVRFN